MKSITKTIVIAASAVALQATTQLQARKRP